MNKTLTIIVALAVSLCCAAQQKMGGVNAVRDDYENMMRLLGITALRPGPSGNPADANHANYDESLANPCPELPDALTTRSGKRVTTPETWWKTRRPEIVEGFEREVYRRVPKGVPAVTWTVKTVDRELVGRVPVIAKMLVGHVDNSAYPLIDVNINMLVVVPVNVKAPVPVLMMFSGRPVFPAPAQPSVDDMERVNASFKALMVKQDPSLGDVFDKYPAYSPITRLPALNFFAPPVDGNPLPTEQLLAAGWVCALLDAGSVQADNGAGLTSGIIGLANKGQFRKPDDWGALRARSWGAARGLDYLETDSLVDARKVGIEGVSQYGKAALVTLAFEPRFAVGLIGSSGKGGATLHRRVFGEAVESLTGGVQVAWR